ncbi:pPIWI_RE_Z domain-containing protein [Pseudogracilibacillus sp. ICA-222130]|uniref:pPIWI_RE_Z domain-containing protein n=1 Tax=Pseudogracilibacillus sp. ICA-222130 TaxID=3134655 RepID=UPI0030C541DF
MSQSFEKLVESTHKKFTYLSKIVVQDIVAVELMGMGIRLMEMNISIRDAWIILTGHDSPIVPVVKEKEIISKLRVLLHGYKGENRWHQVCESYEKVKDEFRLFHCLRQEKFPISKTALFYKDRKKDYRTELCEPVFPEKTKKRYLKGDVFQYERIERGETKSFIGKIPSNLYQNTELSLPAQKTKVHVPIMTSEQLQRTVKEMDSKSRNGTTSWQERIKSFTLKQIQPSSGVHHIIGGLGAGKSTYRDVMTYNAVKKKGARVLIIERTVADAYEKANVYRKLGIHVAVISSIRRQWYNFEQIITRHQVRSVADIDDELAYKDLTGDCIIRNLADDFTMEQENEPFLPCQQLMEPEKKGVYLCPLAQHCGKYEAMNQMHEAEVWITTEAALLSMTLPPMIDLYERTLYEAAYDLVDVIFVDEADQTKGMFENKFITEVPLYIRGNSPTNKLQMDALALSNNERYEPIDEVISWRYMTSHLSHNTEQLYQLINENVHIKEYMARQVTYLSRLRYHLVHSLDGSIQMERELKEYAKKASYHSGEPLSYLGRLTSKEDKRSMALSWIEKHGVQIVSSEETYKQIDKLYVYIYLANIQHALHYIQTNRYMFHKYQLPDHQLVFDQVSAFLPLIRESMTGLKYGFYLERNDNTTQIKLQMYQGMGMDLLYNWHQMYKPLKGTAGPTVIYLSGTSYIKGSPHYHVESAVHWTLSSVAPLPKVEQFMLPIREEETFLYVSGQPTSKRPLALEKMIEALIFHIDKELLYWKERGERRRILLIVNSYQDVEVVQKALSKQGTLKDNYLVLDRRENSLEPKTFHRSKLKDLHKEKEEIFVAPLLAMNRGYNILQTNSNKSLFGSVYFLTRPYPTPNNLPYFVQYLHSLYPQMIQEIKREQLTGVAALRKMRKDSNALFHKMHQEKGTWNYLNESERTVLALFTLIPVWQLIGRLLRGGTDARVFYCDAKFFYDEKNNPTMIDYWKKVLHEEDPHFQLLYEPFINGLHDLKVGAWK